MSRELPEATDYKTTFFDRLGADAGGVHAWGTGIVAGGFATLILLLRGFHWWTLPAATAVGAVFGGLGWLLHAATGFGMSRLLIQGNSTPYVEQYSYQQALVMRGETNEALQSFEAIILEQPNAVLPRIKAAELYVNERKDFRRAAELLGEAQRIPTITPGEDVYATHRLVDLLLGPLAEPGRALVQLRRLIERHPGSAVAARAREALKQLKAELHSASGGE